MLFLALLAAQAVAPTPSELRTFRDWTVGCDNGRRCEAIALLPEGEDWEGWATLSVSREAGAQAAPAFMLPDLETAPAMLAADGARLPVRFSAGVDGINVADEGGELLRALRAGRTIEARDSAGATMARISLAGASAAMLYMDEVQGRVGTITALVRPGTRPAASRAAALPPVRRAPPPGDAAIAPDPVRLATIERQTGCADEMAGSGRPDAEDPVQIATGTTLILLPCGSGAYNFASLPVLARGRRVAVAPFDFQPSGAPPLITNAFWDEERRLLTEYNKGRGLGDCGIAAEYAWDGTRFRLVRYERMDECRGSRRRITTWRAELAD